jgi:RHS repeat-associated protein
MTFRKLVALLAVVLLPLAVQAEETTTYYVNDLLGSPVAAIDEQGNVLWTETYAPYGARIEESPANPGNPAYTGKPEDPVTGLVYMGARWYDPETGRFASVDPVRFVDSNVHSFNRYAYANNSPYVFVDPDGRWSAKAHDALIRFALITKISEADIDRIQAASRYFDKRTQDPESAHKHSMAREGQDAGDAKKMRDYFVQNNLNIAKRFADNGHRNAALGVFGQAIHPVMDSSSPEHTDADGNPRQWRGLEDAFGHSPIDWIGSETSRDISVDIYREQSETINEMYDYVFGED